jgi:sugar phosphate isomerase/epimerase
MAPHRFAVCNEIFGKMPFDQMCREARALGYDAIEIAPFTLADDAGLLSPEKRTELRSTMEANDLCFAGLHWLTVAPAGLHMTTRDEAVRTRTWQHIHRLIDLCADLAICPGEHNGVMVLGSPQQRSATDGMTPREATDILTHELAHAAPHAESRGVKILVEALSPNQTNVITSLADAVCIVKQIGSPAVQTMFDTHNAAGETEPHPELIRRYGSYIKHVHVNEMDGREPGKGDYDFDALLNALSAVKYSGYVSLEVFDLSRDGVEIARSAINYLKKDMPEAAFIQSV